MERCRSGLTGSPGKTVYQKWYRGFESHPFRQVLHSAKLKERTCATIEKIAQALDVKVDDLIKK